MTQQATESNRSVLRAIAHRAMVERGLEPDFSAEALAEVNSIASAARDESVRDLRGLLWCSIDNDDSCDLDQLTVAERAGSGAVKVLVAVADVDALVKAGSAVDGHGRANTTSVYTAGGIFPMLPERLSTDLTSLGEGEERVALVIEYAISPDGEVSSPDIYRGRVLNKAKLAYNSVAAWLDGNGPAPARLDAVPGLEEQLRIQDSAAQALKTRRHQHGALSLETTETKAVFDGDVLADLRPEEKNRAKQLIEDFMIAANGVTARFLDAKGLPSIRRALRSPDRWPRIVELAKQLGCALPDEPDAVALEKFLHERREAAPERFADLSLSVVKLLGAGEYVVEFPGQSSDGHFGLAVKDYAHSTAPNRRFPDLITHRLVKAALTGSPAPYTPEELDDLARHCTQQENNVAKVERQVAKSAAALLLASRIGEEFDGIVTGASPKGTWVRVFNPHVEGRVTRGYDDLDVGDHVRVRLAHVDVEKGFIDFTCGNRKTQHKGQKG